MFLLRHEQHQPAYLLVTTIYHLLDTKPFLTLSQVAKPFVVDRLAYLKFEKCKFKNITFSTFQCRRI